MQILTEIFCGTMFDDVDLKKGICYLKMDKLTSMLRNKSIIEDYGPWDMVMVSSKVDVLQNF